ncbi:MAG: carbon starvation protein A [Phycisphaerales bacterium]
MTTVAIALGSLVLYVIAYRTYGRYLARRIFRIDPDRTTPAHELEDGVDYVPSRRSMVFGHHFTSIAGTGPIVGPAVAVVWGWVPALVWVLVGSIVMGAVHDFGSLVISMRHKGRTVADLAGDVVNARVRLLFLIVVLVGLWIVLAVFGLVIATVFARFPSSVLPVALQVPIAIGLGLWVRKNVNLISGTVVAVGLMYASVWWSASIDWANLWAPNSGLLPAAITSIISPVAFWTLVLLAYVWVASVLPVQWLLQPRDYINTWQLLVAMGLLLTGLLVAHPPIVADAVVMHPEPASSGQSAPPFVPFLFVTIACGAISGFHCLVSSGCSSRQLRTERDAQAIGYGAMLTEGFLAVLVILACVAGIGLGTTFEHMLRLDFPAGLRDAEAVVHLDSERGPGVYDVSVYGRDAWNYHYGTWSPSALGLTLATFVRGAANLMAAVGVPLSIGTAIMGVFIASFAATTMDSACRLQRFIIAELAKTGCRTGRVVCGTCEYDRDGIDAACQCPECGKNSVATRLPGWRGLLANRYAATTLAVLTAGVLALSDGVKVERYYPGVGYLIQITNGRGELEFTTHNSGVNSLASQTGVTVARVRHLRRAGPFAERAIDAFDWPSPRTSVRTNFAAAGTGGLILWPVFGATNQLLGGLALLVLTVWLVRRGRPPWVTALPMVFMLAMTGWAIVELARSFMGPVDGRGGRPGLLVILLLMLGLEVWIVAEAAVLVVRGKRSGSLADGASGG